MLRLSVSVAGAGGQVRGRAHGGGAVRGERGGGGGGGGHAGLALAAGEILPRPVFPYRRVRIQRDQGRGRVRIQVHCISVPFLLIIRFY